MSTANPIAGLGDATRLTEIRQRLLSNVWSGHCRHETTITNLSGTIKSGDLLLVGACAEGKRDLARVIEGK